MPVVATVFVLKQARRVLAVDGGGGWGGGRETLLAPGKEKEKQNKTKK